MSQKYKKGKAKIIPLPPIVQSLGPSPPINLDTKPVPKGPLQVAPTELWVKPAPSPTERWVKPDPFHTDVGNDILVTVFVLPSVLEDVHAFLTSINHPIFHARPGPLTPTRPTSPVSSIQDGSDSYPDMDPELLELFERLEATALETPSKTSPVVVVAQSSPTASTWASVAKPSLGAPAPPPATTSVAKPSSAAPASTSSVAPVPYLVASPVNVNKHRKYFVILKGKVTGVYWQEWHVIERFVKSVPNATYRSFNSKDHALFFYYHAKLENRVCCDRNPGDEILEGNLAA